MQMIYNVLVRGDIRSSSFLIQIVYDFDTMEQVVDLWVLSFPKFKTLEKIKPRGRPPVPTWFYSVLSDSTGLAIAALMAWKLTVINAMSNAVMPANANTHQLKLTR